MTCTSEAASTRERRGSVDQSFSDVDVPLSDSPQPRLTVVPKSGAGELCGERPALIPAGEYRLRFTHWQTAIQWGRSHKVVLHFTVCDQGPHFGVGLRRFYNVQKIVGQPSRNGRFKVGWNHDLVREYALLLPSPQRLDRLYLERLQPLLIVGRVNATTVTAKQKAIPSALQYSVVRELLRVEAGR